LREKRPPVFEKAARNRKGGVPAGDAQAGFLTRLLTSSALECVSKGDCDALEKVMRRTVFVENVRESALPLAETKNRFSVTCALTGGRMAAQGVAENEVGSLMLRFLARRDACRTAESVNALTLELLIECTMRVKERLEARNSGFADSVRTFVDSRIGEKISVAQIAAAFQKNPSYLNTCFKNLTGECVTDYIARRKVEEAKKLLCLPNNQIADIWVSLGFCDQSHFNKTFKKMSGMTPTQYRSRLPETGSGSVCSIDENNSGIIK